MKAIFNSAQIFCSKIPAGTIRQSFQMKGRGTRTYHNVVRQSVNAMLDELRKNGAKITGNNPWFIDTRQSGVKLRGEWSEDASSLVGNAYGKRVVCSKLNDLGNDRNFDVPTQ